MEERSSCPLLRFNNCLFMVYCLSPVSTMVSTMVSMIPTRSWNRQIQAFLCTCKKIIDLTLG